LQETKRQHFDAAYLNKFCPAHLANYEFSPSIGALGGLITIWNGNIFDEVILVNGYSITVKLTPGLSQQSLHVTNVGLLIQMINLALSPSNVILTSLIGIWSI
jgi:hypothetical protein